MTDNGFDADKKDRDDVLFSNRRADTRHNLELNVDFEVSIDGPHTFFTGFTQDISKGGIFLATHQMYPIGTKIKLSFVVESEHLNVEAVVRWVRYPGNILNSDMSPGMGLQFINPGRELTNVFDRFLVKKDPLMIDVD